MSIACALLAASGQLDPLRLEHVALHGELGLDGAVRPVRGTLAIAEAARRARLGALILARAGAREAMLVSDLDVAAVADLRGAARVLAGGRADEPAAVPANARHPAASLDLADVRGQPHAVRALVVAAAGAHNCVLSGPPGTGKTMLARRLPAILPPLTHEQAIEVARIRSVCGEPIAALPEAPPFRAPHHSITAAGLIGGAQRGWVGEAVLAHDGVLFLDELAEFPRRTLDALRQPLEDGRVAIARARHVAIYPSRFVLLAAMNPCPCGYAGAAERCTCSDAELMRYRRRLSGPLRDRVDLFVALTDTATPTGDGPALSSRVAREQVRVARERQAHRLRDEPVAVNAHMDASLLRRHARLDDRGRELLTRARACGMLSARGEHRVLRVARTLADLDGCERVRPEDVCAALALRADTSVLEHRPAAA